ncbi:hypothetical protein DSO57_1014088 [Entomophthora muscae]|uniref:Uncharacterized protein n=1 Tax=Entomophthora muscae TaxID=34485 RepID=A0ACC2UFZ2_9FUNG|nr:hypothetical protein DSO57_1014088 [Entomophthora muscae]
MLNIGREFIREEFARLLQNWYQPTGGLAPAEVQVYDGDARLVIGKVLEEFALMQAKYKLLTNLSPLLENDDSSKPVPGYNPGHTMETGDQEPHNNPTHLLSLFDNIPGCTQDLLVTSDNLVKSLIGYNLELLSHEPVFQNPHKLDPQAFPLCGSKA